ncbi:hypothetical protein [Streptomyces sp. NPDC046759]
MAPAQKLTRPSYRGAVPEARPLHKDGGLPAVRHRGCAHRR